MYSYLYLKSSLPSTLCFLGIEHLVLRVEQSDTAKQCRDLNELCEEQVYFFVYDFLGCFGVAPGLVFGDYCFSVFNDESAAVADKCYPCDDESQAPY